MGRDFIWRAGYDSSSGVSYRITGDNPEIILVDVVEDCEPFCKGVHDQMGWNFSVCSDVRYVRNELLTDQTKLIVLEPGVLPSAGSLPRPENRGLHPGGPEGWGYLNLAVNQTELHLVIRSSFQELAVQRRFGINSYAAFLKKPHLIQRFIGLVHEYVER